MSRRKRINKQVDRAMKVIRVWRPLISPEYNGRVRGEWKGESVRPGWHVQMSMDANSTYLDYEMVVYAKACEPLDKYEFEQAVIHELLHIRFRDAGVEHGPAEERFCQVVSRALLHAKELDRH